MSRFYSGIQAILFITLLTGFAASECQGQQLYTLRAETVEVEALGQVQMKIFLDVHTPLDLANPVSQVAAIQFGLSYQAQLTLVCVNKGSVFTAQDPGVFMMNSQDQMLPGCPEQDFDSNLFTPVTSPGESDAIFMLQAWNGSSIPGYFSGLDNELAVLTFESAGKAGAWPILIVGDLMVGSLGTVSVTVVDAIATDHSEDFPVGNPDVVTEDGQVLVRPSPVTEFTCNVTDECLCDVSMNWVNGETYNTLKLYKTNTDPSNLVETFADPLTTTATTVQMDSMTSYLLVGTSNGVDSTPATCTIASSCSLPDEVPPVIVGMPLGTKVDNTPGSCEGVATWTETPSADDNCDGIIAAVPDIASGSTFPLGDTTVTYTATDIAGNISTATFVVTVNDNEDPFVVLPVPVEVTGDGSSCTFAVTVPVPVANDNCDVDTLTNDFNGTGDASGDYPYTTTLVTWTVTDVNGNFAIQFQNVTVTPPLDCNSNGESDGCDISTGFSQDINLNGIPDECEVEFIRGDANGNGTINIGDPYWLLLYLFNGSSSSPGQLSCKDAADANDDEMIDVSDAVFLYSALMGGGAAPSATGPNCGEDPTGLPGSLSCDSYAGCP